MKRRTRRGEEIRAFIIQMVPKHPRDVVSVTCKRFKISRQAVNRYVRALVDRGQILAEGTRNQRQYALRVLNERAFTVPLSGLEENELWRTRVAPNLPGFPENVLDIWHYCFTEMVNNAIDHSDGRELVVDIKANTYQTEVLVCDNGIGIFQKIKAECHLDDERHAVLELAKGKLTTDPERHTGEGIFFTSRVLDSFMVISGGVFFSHEHGEEEDWILERDKGQKGTIVQMVLTNNSTRTLREVFDRFASDDNDYGFTKTVVPVRLARQGVEQLVSRSQARRLLARLDRFDIVLLDFTDVASIGQSFADEIFRVFARCHSNITLREIHTSPSVKRMISRARTATP